MKSNKPKESICVRLRLGGVTDQSAFEHTISLRTASRTIGVKGCAHTVAVARDDETRACAPLCRCDDRINMTVAGVEAMLRGELLDDFTGALRHAEQLEILQHLDP